MTTSPEVGAGPPRRGAIGRRFRDAGEEGRAALIAYVTAGYPGPDATPAVLDALVAAGVDVIELGLPFSDPLADGPTIQRASYRAIQQGMNAERALSLLRSFRARHDLPVVLFTYLNPVLRYGPGRFLADAAAAGADGILFTDLPVGADPELEDAVPGAGLDLIRLVAPTTPAARLAEIARHASGFLYYISRTGVTGARASLREGLAEEVGRLRQGVGLPVAVGFGISTPEQAGAVGRLADGVVVGSAVVEALERGGAEEAGRFLRGLREAMDAAPAVGSS